MNVRLNYYALGLSLAQGCLSEIAFDQLEKEGTRFKVDNEDDAKAIKLLHYEDLLTYREIGELYDVHRSYIFRVLNYRKRRNDTCPDELPVSAAI
ncbi:MAG: hypothetical protein ABFD04_11635 [Syntrophomonas sp.]